MQTSIVQKFMLKMCLVWLVLGSGCATVVQGTTQSIGVGSTPPGATVTIDNSMKAVTPTTVELKRNRNHTFLFEKEGYQSDSFAIASTTSGWVWGNVLLGGLVGGMVDFASGAARKLSHDSVHVTLAPLPPEPAPVAETESAPSAEAQEPTTKERLQEIEQLKVDGYMTEEEYEQKRIEILGDL